MSLLDVADKTIFRSRIAFFSFVKHNDTILYVVVQFYPWFKFYFPLFLGMVIYDNEFETMKNKI